MAFLFACVTGFSPSMTRAALVAGLSLLAWYCGRKFHPVVLLTLVAAATAALNPFYVWGDAGWYMSFMAFAGVIILAPLIRDYFWRDKNVPAIVPSTSGKKWLTTIKTWGQNLRQIAVETMSAQIMTLPIIALMLGQFAPYGLLANLLVLPIVPLTMLLAFVAGLAGWLVPAIASGVGWPAQTLLDYIIGVADTVSQLPGASQSVDFGPGWFVVSMGVLLLAIVYMQRRTSHSFREDNVVV
jgi:competence protein ComEC